MIDRSQRDARNDVWEHIFGMRVDNTLHGCKLFVDLGVYQPSASQTLSATPSLRLRRQLGHKSTTAQQHGLVRETYV